jgi:hypothetical protein
MRAGSVSLNVNGQTSGSGLVLSLLARQIQQYGSPDAIAQKTDDYLAALNPPQSRPRSEHDRDAELYRSVQEPLRVTEIRASPRRRRAFSTRPRDRFRHRAPSRSPTRMDR